MAFSTSLTKKLMEVTAISMGFSTGREYVVPDNNYVRHHVCACKRCCNNRGKSCCQIIVNPPESSLCRVCLAEFERNRAAIGYSSYIDELWQEMAEDECSIRKQKFTSPKVKSYSYNVHPYHQHIYRNDKFTDIKSLNGYLKKEEKKSIINSIMLEYFDMKSYSDNFWNCYVVDNTENGPRLTRRLMYQTSTESYDLGSKNLIQELQRIHGVDSISFHKWIYRLRQWISATILERLVDEIEKVNRDLAALGFNKVSIGTTGLNILENISPSTVPTLPTLLAFLEVSPYQNYVVQRISELAKSKCLNDYVWNSGGTYKDQPWHPNLPTDAELIMHFFCTYLDQILPLTCYRNQKPFTMKYFIKRSQLESMNDRTKVKIIETMRSPPHYDLFINSETQDLPSGKYNLFYALILLFRHIQLKLAATIENINLGKSGLNLLWIFT